MAIKRPREQEEKLSADPSDENKDFNTGGIIQRP